jgi:hypothetical protein
MVMKEPGQSEFFALRLQMVGLSQGFSLPGVSFIKEAWNFRPVTF